MLRNKNLYNKVLWLKTMFSVKSVHGTWKPEVFSLFVRFFSPRIMTLPWFKKMLINKAINFIHLINVLSNRVSDNCVNIEESSISIYLCFQIFLWTKCAISQNKQIVTSLSSLLLLWQWSFLLPPKICNDLVICYGNDPTLNANNFQ